MARTPQVKGGRPVVVATRLSEAEARQIDGVRGSLSRGEWLRWQALRSLGADPAQLTGSSPTSGAETG